MDAPKHYTCAACLIAKRVCLCWMGEGRWATLHLLPEARPIGADTADTGYYIFEGPDRSMRSVACRKSVRQHRSNTFALKTWSYGVRLSSS